MAKIIENNKQFKVLSLSVEDLDTLKWGVLEDGVRGAVCAFCNDLVTEDIHYLAVINDTMCPKCFQSWVRTAVNYPSDRKIEEKNFNNTVRRLEK